MHQTASLLLASLLVVSTPSLSAKDLCTLIVDAKSGAIVLEQGADCTSRVTPASTFKIAISLMGYDAGVLTTATAPSWPFKEGYPDWAGDKWKRDIDPAAWMKDSVFWYSQQVLQKLGQARFAQYVKSFDYGNGDVSAVPVQDPGSNGVWVMSSLQISPAEQVAFLRKLVNRQLSLSSTAYEMTTSITKHPAQVHGWDVYGKTGTGSPGQDNKYRADSAYGWYVGWANKAEQTLVFAHLIQDEQAQTPNAGLRAREQLLQQLASLP